MYFIRIFSSKGPNVKNIKSCFEHDFFIKKNIYTRKQVVFLNFINHEAKHQKKKR